LGANNLEERFLVSLFVS